MLRFARLFWAAVAATLLTTASVLAQAAPEWMQCVSEDRKTAPDSILNACSAVIAAGSETQPNLAVAYGRRGKAYLDKGEHDKAIADYTKAIEANPRDSFAYNSRGIAYRAKGDLDKAIADYGVAIELDGESASAYTNRGIAYRAKGDLDRAIEDHTRAIEVDAESLAAFHNRSIAYRAKGDLDKAIADANEAIEIHPGYAAAFNNRGLAHAAKGDNDSAIADFNAAIDINPRYAGAYQNRGLAYAAKGDAEHAAEDAAMALAVVQPPPEETPAIAGVATDAPDPAGIEKVALTTDDAPASPFPLVLRADLGAQQLTVIENGRVLHVWPISSGTQGYATPTGTFQPRSANRMWYSRQYNWTPMPYAIFFVRGVAFHGTNVTSRLGRSASHGCVRLATSNAAVLFDLVHKHGFQQTQIVVFGAARHDAPGVARRAAPKREVTAQWGLPDWARALFGQ
jgi:tetratricopeptide (TPR) repeat protein